MGANTDWVIVVHNEILSVEAGVEGFRSKIDSSAFLSEWHAECFMEEVRRINDSFTGRSMDSAVLYNLAERLRDLISDYKAVEWIII
jgi:hypothetical protein